MTDQASSTPKPAKRDERNIVAVDPAASQATLEERLTSFWAQNRTVILLGILLVIAAIAGRSIWEGHVASRQAEIRAAFGRAETAEAKLAFAREHAENPLAGVALVEAADDAYAKADYSTAAAQYAQAATSVAEPLILARARMGEAVSTLQGGTPEKGEEMLRKIANDSGAPEAIRAEAWYHLATYNHEAGNDTAAREALNKVSEVSPRGMWTMRAAALMAKMPPEAAPGAAPAMP